MSTEINVRALALETLTDIDREMKNASDAIHATLRNYQYLDKKDRSFYTRICQGTLEYRIQLDYFINQVSKTPVNKCKPYIRNLLRMSLYQIRYMDRVANEAVCNEAVKLAKKKGFQNLSGFVNGVLRNLIRNQEALKLPDKPDAGVKSVISEDDYNKRVSEYYSVNYSMPEWIVNRFLKWYPEDIVEKMLQAFLEEAPLSVRVNLQKTTVAGVKEELERNGIQVQRGKYCENILKLSEYNYLNRIAAFRDGRITVQDESSCLQGYLVPVDGVEVILDICAAPGGKTMHAAERLLQVSEKGVVISRDLSEGKVERIRENVERMEYTNIRTQIWDALETDETLIGKADVIIADVPCSGLGVIGRKQDIKYRLEEKQLEELKKLQRDILKAAGRYLKADGTMIYSTCTVNPEENEAQLAWMKQELNLELMPIRELLPPGLVKEVENQPGTDLDAGYCTLIPGLQSCDGFFFAKLRKAEGIY